MATESSIIKDNDLKENFKNSSRDFTNPEHVNSTRKYSSSNINTSASSPSSSLMRKRTNSGTSLSTVEELLEIKQLLRRISEDVTDLKGKVEEGANNSLSSAPNTVISDHLKPALKKVTFVETAHTIDELIKFKMECKNRVYDVIYNSRGQKTVVGPAYVDEEQIIKLSIREKARIYIPGKSEPLQVIGEIATAVLRIGTSTFSIETALHRDRNTPVVLGKEFGKKFIVSVNTEHKILTLKDDNGVPCAITYELYSEP